MTPLARRIASEFGLDPSKIQGTGEGGRITREDVLNAAKAASERGAPPKRQNRPKPPKPAEGCRTESAETGDRPRT